MVDVLDGLQDMLPSLEETYKDLHSHPELSKQEHRTAGLCDKHLQKHGYEVISGLGGTGVVGVLKNGDGPVVLLRADMDALPVKESTGLDYASTAKAEGSTPVAHACGHDMHVTWLQGVSALFSQNRSAWTGTLIALFQPAEETAEGAQAMIGDGLFGKIPKPDVVLGQHVMVGPAGSVAIRPGPITFAADSLEIRMYGKGAHGSMPQSSIDPVVMAASTVLRLQTIVSRELSPMDQAVVTIGSVQAGSKSNVIPDEAVIQLNIRTLDDKIRKRVLSAIERIVNAEAEASRAPKKPTITTIDSYPLNVNNDTAAETVQKAMQKHFKEDAVQDTQPNPASEDFGTLGTASGVPTVYWFVHGTDPKVYKEAEENGTIHELPVNHGSGFAPVLHPTLSMGIEAMGAAAMAWLGKEKQGQ